MKGEDLDSNVAYIPPSGPMYLAQFAEPATISLQGGPLEVLLNGEILVTQPSEDYEEITIDQFRRVSLWIDSLEDTEAGGLISLAGPAGSIEVEPGSGGLIDPFDLRVFYPALGQLDFSCEESDADYPQLETLRGQLNWDAGQKNEDRSFRMFVSIVLEEIIDGSLGIITGLDFGEVLTFQPLQPPKDEELFANSLVACIGSAPTPAAGNNHERRRLRLRFVNLTKTTSSASLETLAQRLINSACRVWWQKAGVRIEPEAAIATPTNNPWGGTVTYGQESALPVDSGAAVSNAVEVYLVDNLAGDASHLRPGGGVTKLCGSSGAYVILEVGKAENNNYLLAHELGHVLGLRHPGAPPPTATDSCQSFLAGSYCSVMVTDDPNSDRNTQNNLTVTEQPTNPLGPVFISFSPPQFGGWDADPDQGYFHMVRDFPYDDGENTASGITTEPGTSFDDWWTYSDVWNYNRLPNEFTPNQYADGTAIFAANHSPNHTNPTYGGPNYMYARVHTCQPLANSVEVYLYLAVPGDPSAPLHPLNGGSPLIFSGTELPGPGNPKTKHVSWTVPNLYSKDCCVFAVARSANQQTLPQISAIIANPAAHHFYDLFALLKSSNDVAQRNLHIAGVPTGVGFSLLPPVFFMNPLEQIDPAFVIVDAQGAVGLSSLTLEVNGDVVQLIEPGGRQKIRLHEAFSPNERFVVRLRAEVPAEQPLGREFSVGVQFFVGDEMVNGYRYRLRMVTLRETAVQVLDNVVGMLRDVGVAFNWEPAHTLSSHVRFIAQKAAADGDNWFLEIRQQHPFFTQLAADLGGQLQVDALHQEIGLNLQKLAALVASQEPPARPFFLEEMRTLTNRIHAPTAQIGRMHI